MSASDQPWALTDDDESLLPLLPVHPPLASSPSPLLGSSPAARSLDLVARCAAAPGARVSSLGLTLDGRELECITVGQGPLHCWVIHRQHPGE